MGVFIIVLVWVRLVRNLEEVSEFVLLWVLSLGLSFVWFFVGVVRLKFIIRMCCGLFVLLFSLSMMLLGLKF